MRLSATTEEITKHGKRLVGDADNYLATVKNIYTTVDGLRAHWQGSDNQQFVATVYSYKENIEALGRVVGNYGVFLQETGIQLGKLQAELTEQSARL